MLQALLPRGGISEYVKGSNTNCLEETVVKISPFPLMMWKSELGNLRPIILFLYQEAVLRNCSINVPVHPYFVE